MKWLIICFDLISNLEILNNVRCKQFYNKMHIKTKWSELTTKFSGTLQLHTIGGDNKFIFCFKVNRTIGNRVTVERPIVDMDTV